jgi:hypothetical protein
MGRRSRGPEDLLYDMPAVSKESEFGAIRIFISRDYELVNFEASILVSYCQTIEAENLKDGQSKQEFPKAKA